MSTRIPPRGGLVDFKEVKSHVTITQILERYDLMRTLKRSGDRLSGPCPIHQGTNPTQFRVSVSKNCWNCFGNCGRGGNIIDFVSLREGLPFRDAALLLQEWFMPEKAETKLAESAPPPCRSLPSDSTAAIAASSEDEDEAGENPPLSFELKSLKQDHPYLAERGLTTATVKSYGIGLCGRGCLRGYIAIPIRDRHDKLVAYIGRWPGNPPDDKPKFKLPKGFKKRLELFNIERALREPARQPLLVVEGVFDCLRLVQLGYPRTVALLGSSLSERQEVLIRDVAGSNGPVCLLLDADEAGRHGAADAASRLSRFCAVRCLDIGEFRHQPDQLEKSELESLLHQSQ